MVDVREEKGKDKFTSDTIGTTSSTWSTNPSVHVDCSNRVYTRPISGVNLA